MEQILYSLDGLTVGADPFAATSLEFTGLGGIGSGPIDRDLSFNDALGMIIGELDLTNLSFSGTDVVTVAWDLNVCVGLSIVKVEGATGWDGLTWVHPMVRHCGLGTALKAHALAAATRVGVTGLWVASDDGATAFYRTLGVLPA